MNSNFSRQTTSIIIAVTCVIFYFSHSNFDFNSQSDFQSKLLYIFSHANIFHLTLNLIALFRFKPRIKTCFVAFISSAAAAFIPFASMELPTCGLSGFLMACYARRYCSHRLNIIWIIASNLAMSIIPVLNWKIHLLSFFIAYSIWHVIQYQNTQKKRS